MNHTPPATASWAERLADATLVYRWPVVLATLILSALALAGLRDGLKFDASYRIFFSEENPQLQAFDALQKVYTKDDNIMFVLTAKEGSIYREDFLEAVQWLTDRSWQMTYSRRVDSITNFQNSEAEADDLFVDDLVPAGAELDGPALERIQEIALAEPALFNRIVNADGFVTGVNVTVTLPGLDDMTETPEVVADAQEIAAEFRALFPDIELRLAGVVMLNNAFSASSQRDMETVMLGMFAAIFLIMAILLRSALGTLVSGAIVAISIGVSMGMLGWYGYNLNPPLASAPTMIMTLAVADSIHILVTFFNELRQGRDKRAAIIESMRVNFAPVFITSATTAVGFLSMNFSDAPPFRQLGNVVATGVMAAWALSVFFLPAVVSLLPFKARVYSSSESRAFDRFSAALSRRRVPVLVASAAAVAIMGSLIPRIDLNDQWVKYFGESLEFRQHADYADSNLAGMTNFEFSIPAAGSGGIAEPAYLGTLDSFAAWYRQQENVSQVNTLADVMKRLNKNMHGDDPAYYEIPDSRELAAQYLLLYEFSLPYGLDLNNQINVDKSATRVTVTTRDVPTKELRALIEKGERWLEENAPEYMRVQAASPTVMFAHISERNIKSMLGGTILAVFAISLLLALALRSVKYGLISLIPNLVPAILGFGLWSMIYGEMGLSLAMVTGMTLGIVVDDTAHFLSKYLRARREKGYSAEEAARYAFRTVGKALIVTTVILVVGFSILGLSSFRLNSWMGQLTAIVIVFALLADFVLLPALLMAIDGRAKRAPATPHSRKDQRRLAYSAND